MSSSDDWAVLQKWRPMKMMLLQMKQKLRVPYSRKKWKKVFLAVMRWTQGSNMKLQDMTTGSTGNSNAL